mmetsp:Transcript_14856/g.34989  ORF Transcript_14856/g.34989 Transcript_14856/m.34989 type:complete len:230 (-) Transcript_14856:114-803(-)
MTACLNSRSVLQATMAAMMDPPLVPDKTRIDPNKPASIRALIVPMWYMHMEPPPLRQRAVWPRDRRSFLKKSSFSSREKAPESSSALSSASRHRSTSHWNASTTYLVPAAHFVWSSSSWMPRWLRFKRPDSRNLRSRRCPVSRAPLSLVVVRSSGAAAGRSLVDSRHSATPRSPPSEASRSDRRTKFSKLLSDRASRSPSSTTAEPPLDKPLRSEPGVSEAPPPPPPPR